MHLYNLLHTRDMRLNHMYLPVRNQMDQMVINKSNVLMNACYKGYLFECD
jgi:hypothetical protein